MNIQSPVVGKDVSEAVFGQEYNEGLVHQLVVTYMANARAGTRPGIIIDEKDPTKVVIHICDRRNFIRIRICDELEADLSVSNFA